MMYAKEMGMTIKLLASSKRHGDHLHAIVAPFLLGKDHPLYNVDDVFNAVFVEEICLATPCSTEAARANSPQPAR